MLRRINEERGLLILYTQQIVYMIRSYKTNQSLKQGIMARLNGRIRWKCLWFSMI